MQLKYNETGREKDCLPRVGQWNMMNKVLNIFWIVFCKKVYNQIVKHFGYIYMSKWYA